MLLALTHILHCLTKAPHLFCTSLHGCSGVKHNCCPADIELVQQGRPYCLMLRKPALWVWLTRSGQC